MKDKPTVFISFNSKYKGFVDILENRLSKDAIVHRYENEIGPWDSFTEFMDTIKDHDVAVLVVSDDYLKSYACMYEVLRVMENPDWKDKVLIALMADTEPYKDENRVEYIEYWCKQYDDLSERVKKLPSETVGELAQKVEKVKVISESIDKFLGFLADSNCPPIYDVINDICDRVKISRKAVFKYEDAHGNSYSMKQILIMDYIKENPFATVPQVSGSLGVSRCSARYNINSLLKSGEVKFEKRGKYKVYCIA